MGHWWASSGAGWFAEAEIRPVNPHAVENNPELAGESDLGPLGTTPFRDVHRPGLERRPGGDTGHDHVGGLKQCHPHCGVAGPADRPVPVRLARLVLARGEADAGAHLLGGPEALGLIDRRTE